MIEINEIKIEGKHCIGLKVLMPDAPPLIMVRGERGVLFCGYLNPEAAEKLHMAAAIVRGVASLEEALEKPVVYVTKQAEALGATVGMSGKDALRQFL
ncbi:MAG: DUF1805 domain-containing protein [Candidatus Methanomethylicus sp.]|nr:DUF1805 domain-containing protein [Candidatus Methanomethylicus sp.]